MPRTKREFIKIELRLFNDDDFFLLRPIEQLVWIKIIAISKQKQNKIPKKPYRLIPLLKLELSPTDLRVILRKLKKSFHNFKSCKWYYYLENYGDYYANGTPSGTEREINGGVDKEKDKEKEKEIINPAEEIYEFYKKEIKGGARVDAIKNIQRLLKGGAKKEDLINHVKAYKQHLIKSKKTDPGYYIQANNFFGKKERWKEFEPPKFNPPDPNCKACGGKGFVYVQAKSDYVECECRKTRKEGK